MAKYTEQQVELNKKHLTVAEMGEIAKKYGKHPGTLRNILVGVFSYDGGDKERQAMIKEAQEIIKERILNDVEIVKGYE